MKTFYDLLNELKTFTKEELEQDIAIYLYNQGEGFSGSTPGFFEIRTCDVSDGFPLTDLYDMDQKVIVLTY